MTATVETAGGFFLGTHQPGWLVDGQAELFVSDWQLRKRHRLPVAAREWALDSGAFTTHQRRADFDPPAVYAARVRRYRDEIGRLQWAAPQDWMCEPAMLATTGLTVAEHQRRTVTNFVALRDTAPDLPFVPVVQGWIADDYLRCLDLYAAPISHGGADLDLTTAGVVGLGTVCRRQATNEAGHIITTLHAAGLHRLHGFGVKILGLRRFGHMLHSADSLAWSYGARRRRTVLPDCVGHANCANCRRYAYRWHATVAGAFTATHRQHQQGYLFGHPTTASTTVDCHEAMPDTGASDEERGTR
jgi:hypothetical protein